MQTLCFLGGVFPHRASVRSKKSPPNPSVSLAASLDKHNHPKSQANSWGRWDLQVMATMVVTQVGDPEKP